MYEKRICLKIPKPPKKDERRCIQIGGEANRVLERLCRLTGLLIGTVVSQMIIQGEDLVDIVEEED